MFVTFTYVELFSDYLEPLCSSLTYFELGDHNSSFDSKPHDPWQIMAYFNYKPDLTLLQSQVDLLANNCTAPKIQLILEIVDDCDWVLEIEKRFVPFSVGRYFIYSAAATQLPPSRYPLRISASRAFGTGEHETTSSCLIGLTKLAKQSRFSNMLDMGAGTAILAIAMAKSWKNKVTAIDIDQQAVRVAKENCKKNRVSNLVQNYAGNGYLSKRVKQNGRYDLIVANILAKPLKKFAPNLKKNLKSGGVVILSGLLASQERMVLSAHMQQGLYLKRRIKQNGWNTLILN
jgi:ribosomal protein L11 methyltransferase